MKLLTNLVIVFSLTCSFVMASEMSVSADALDSAVVDALLESYSKTASVVDFKMIPDQIICGNEKLIVGLKPFLDQKVLRTNKDNSGVVIDWSNGDQVGGLFVLTNDLVNLNSKKTTSIPAKVYEGFWWADGSHYSLKDINCRLK